MTPLMNSAQPGCCEQQFTVSTTILLRARYSDAFETLLHRAGAFVRSKNTFPCATSAPGR